MRYMLLISADEADTDEIVSQDGRAAFATWLDGLIARGVLRAHEGLQPSRSATTVRVRGDQVLLTDGPYLEAKDQIGGFALIEVDDLDAAVEIAAAHPACGVGQIEIRPLRDDVRHPWQP